MRESMRSPSRIPSATTVLAAAVRRAGRWSLVLPWAMAAAASACSLDPICPEPEEPPDPVAAPATALVSAPVDPTRRSNPVFEFRCNRDTCRFECRLDDEPFAPCESPKAYPALRDGRHAFAVRAIDADGVTEAAEHTWTIDARAPTTELSEVPRSPTSSTTAVFQFECDEPVCNFACELDGETLPCDSPWPCRDLDEGEHRFRVHAADPAGNVETASAAATHRWTVDTTAPDTRLLDVPLSPSRSSTTSFAYECDEGACTFECNLDGADYQPCASPTTATDLGDGMHMFVVRATDGAGNRDGSPAYHVWSVDRTPPAVFITDGPASETTHRSATFHFTCTEMPCAFTCAVDRAAPAPCTSPTTVSVTTFGEHHFAVWAEDIAGNASPAPAEYAWTMLGQWRRVAAKDRTTCAIASDGSLWCWGYNRAGVVGHDTSLTEATPSRVGTDQDWRDVYAGIMHACAIKVDGTLWCWGLNSYGMLGDNAPSRTEPTQVGLDGGWREAALGQYFTCGLRTNGTVWCWGHNDYGQLGNGVLSPPWRITPTQVGADQDWAQIVSGSRHACARKTDGTAWCWGSNGNGEAGGPTHLAVDVPGRVGTSALWRRISSAGPHTCGTRTDGTLWCWGYNGAGQLGDGTQTNSAAPVQVGVQSDWQDTWVGGTHSCATKTDGRVFCWGNNASGQFGDGTTASSATPVGTCQRF